MATGEDIYIEADGKRVYFLTKTSAGADTSGQEIITVPEMSVVHRANVELRSHLYIAHLLSGGISGNAIAVQYLETSASGGAPLTSGDMSGDLVDLIVAGN